MREGGRLYTGYASVSSETHNLQRVFHPGGGGGVSPINRLSRYVPHKRVGFFYPFWSEIGYQFRPFWSEIGYGLCTLVLNWVCFSDKTISLIMFTPTNVYVP